MRILKSLFNIFFPDVCIGCKQPLLVAERMLCVSCTHQLPVTQFHNEQPEVLKNVFYGQVLFQNATALFYFHKKGICQQLIHRLKYRGNQEIGVYLGEWMASQIQDNPQYQNVDIVVPVPIHPKKLRRRGFNQLEKFGKIIANKLQSEYDNSVLIRVKDTKSQTFKSSLKRSENIDKVFRIIDTEKLKGKHVLLIDDVITTGATVVACAQQLNKTEDIKLSLVVMAYTEKS